MIKHLSILFLLSCFAATSLQAEPLEAGDPAPKLTTTDQNGEPVDLEAAFAEGVSLVYFYPKADTPGCTKQACNLRDFRDDLADAGIKVFGVSGDVAAAQKSFETKYELNFTLLADPDAAVMNAFGVPVRNGHFAARQSFLIRDGIVVWHQPQANPVTQAQDAIAALQALN